MAFTVASVASNDTGNQILAAPQQTKHGFYTEFSMNETDGNSVKHGFTKFINSLKPTSKCISGLLPILSWLPSYKVSWFRRDFIAGITVSILLVPQSLAYATLAGLPPEWGLYASVTPIIFYVLFSTSRRIAIGPVATTSIMVATAVESVMQNIGADSNDMELYQSIAMTLSFVCGVILVIFGLLRIGFITVFLSRPVMTGFIMSAAFIILSNQFRSLLGLDIGRYPIFYETIIAVFTNIYTINWYTTLISVISLFILFLPKCCCFVGKIPKWIPIQLIVMVLFILISYFTDLESLGVSIIGVDIQSGFPLPTLPNFNYIGDVFGAAMVVAIVTYIGSIALSKDYERKTKEIYKKELSEYNAWCRDNIDDENDNDKDIELDIPSNDQCNNKQNKYQQIKLSKKPLSLAPISLDPNMEFIAYGISNIFGSFFHSQVISASFSRSALNFEMNGHTQISSIIQSIICLLCLLFLMPTLSALPQCVLASVVTVSVHRLIKNGINEFKFLWNISKMELIEFLMAAISPLIIGLEIGIFLSIATSIIVNLCRHSIFTKIIYLGRLKWTVPNNIDNIDNNNNNNNYDNIHYVDCNSFNDAMHIPHITLIEMKAEISYTNNNHLVDKLRDLLCDGHGHKYIVVSLNLTAYIDTTSIRQIVNIFKEAKDSYICLSQCRPKVIELFKRYENESNNNIFPENIKIFISTHDAVRYLQYIRNKHISENDISQQRKEEEEPINISTDDLKRDEIDARINNN